MRALSEFGTVGEDGTLSDCERSFWSFFRNHRESHYFNLKAMKIFSIESYREVDL